MDKQSPKACASRQAKTDFRIFSPPRLLSLLASASREIGLPGKETCPSPAEVPWPPLALAGRATPADAVAQDRRDRPGAVDAETTATDSETPCPPPFAPPLPLTPDRRSYMQSKYVAAAGEPRQVCPVRVAVFAVSRRRPRFTQLRKAILSYCRFASGSWPGN